MKKINGLKLREIIESGVNSISNNKQRIDSLNVFPVPDGDTGSNMSSTAEYAWEQIKYLKTDSIGEISEKFAKGMLMGARGNSGVILSQIFKGFSMGLKGKKEATPFDIVKAFDLAREYAYKAVMNPVEGTILTVIRMTYEKLAKTITVSNTIEETLSFANAFARETTDKTPDLLPILKEVGVVDSGGEGLALFLQGLHLALSGKKVSLNKGPKKSFGKPMIEIGEHHEDEFGYCTEFLINLKNKKTFQKEKFDKELARLGTSIVAIQDEEILKVHIHSFKPGGVLTFAIKYGEFRKVKIDNMTIQANETNSHTSEDINENVEKVINGIAVISCNTGQGIINEMKELGVHFIIEAGQTSNPSAKEFGAHYIIEAGQTSNPSAKEFIKAIKETKAEKVIILPNNSNIILAAQQAAQTSNKEVVVISSKSQMQGVAAMMNFDSGNTFIENKEEMEEAINNVKAGQVTKAVRTTKIEGVNIKEDEYLAIAERKILKSDPSRINAAIEISKKLIDDDTEIVTIYYGDNATETDAGELSSYIEMHHDVEVEIKSGNQKVYDFLISYE